MKNKRKLDRGSIRSSPRYGLSTPYRLTNRNSVRLFHIFLFNRGDLHLVLTPLNLSTLNAGILIMMQKVRLMMFSLNMVDYSMSFLLLSTWVFCWTSRGDHSEPFLLFDFWCGTLPSCLKVIGWGGGGGVVAYEILVSVQCPLVLGFWVLGLRVWGLGLTIEYLDGAENHINKLNSVIIPLLLREEQRKTPIFTLRPDYILR